MSDVRARPPKCPHRAPSLVYPARSEPSAHRARPTGAARIIVLVPVRPAILVLGGLLALAAAGCGASEREADAATVAERFYAALEQRDGEAACAELSEETASKLEQQEEAPCEEAVLALEPAGDDRDGMTE